MSRPIRFDLVTLFVGTTVWAALLAGMRLLGFPPRGYVGVSVYLISVGTSLVVFRKYNRPLSISISCGIVVVVLGELFLQLVQGTPARVPRLELVVCGAGYGTIAFFVFNGVQILSAWVRLLLNRKVG
ncbi:hypothetical protein [Adhaeretor mobilis]|uniref:Uncharacterized protein n=1 Tax=Adhaeretor mobilis TaxID=1930276 RepID=A0A517MQ48_9BACT|nr:hypothetical protein [Adhaeretor mobilis]QDS96994.1 hypothetical protein HG15A2_02530 [Adhaeretor mobilis]